MHARSPFIVLVSLLAGCGGRVLASDTGASETSSSSDSSDSSGDSTDVPAETTGTDTDSNGSNDDDCAQVSGVLEYLPPRVMFALDTSSSMVQASWDHDQDPNTAAVTRWQTLHGVLDEVLAQFGPSLDAGAQRFPSAQACPLATPETDNCYALDACITAPMPEVAAAVDNGAALLAALPGPAAGLLEVAGHTPISAVLASVYASFGDVDPQQRAKVVLISDGAANCGAALPMPDAIELYDDSPLDQAAAALSERSISTFVIALETPDMLVGEAPDDALPAANPLLTLHELAAAGGSEAAALVTNQAELAAALESLLAGFADCVVDLEQTDFGPPPPVVIPFFSIWIEGQAVPLVEDCETQDGWMWLEPGQVLTLCGSFCSEFAAGAITDVSYGCVP